VAKLYVERGPLRGKEVFLKEGMAYTIGRSSSCALTLRDDMASREHAQVLVKGGRYYIRDLDSSNGTYVNGAQLRKTVELKLGDQIEVGDTLMSLLADDERQTTGGLIGREIAGYRILERVGRGGMGTVYRAHQRSLNRVVAFKVLSPSLAWDKEFTKRFVDEVRAAAQLAHPNIVCALDVGEAEGVHYFVMEYMAGGSIEERIEQDGRIAPDRALPMLLDVARGLAYAEEQGIIHRDIKPENLMLDEQGTVKIVDLGIACQLQGKRSSDQSEGVFGTAHYIAPEQAAGETIDHRADLYSLGATAYHMLCGHTVFSGKSQTEIMEQHVEDEPVPLHEVAPWVPRSLCDLVMRLLEKNPDNRYASARELIEALDDISAGGARVGRPIELQHVERIKRLTDKPKTTRYDRERRNRKILVAVIGGLLLLAVLLFLIVRP